MNVLSLLNNRRKTWISVISLLAIAKSSKAVEPVNAEPVQTGETFSPNQTVSNESRKPCVKHPKLAKYFCASAEQLQNVRPGVPEIDEVTRPEEALLNVTNEESDAAVEIFGCDCIASINCLRRLRNQIPES